MPLPAGVFLGFSDTQIKNTYAGLGLAGTCVDAPAGGAERAIESRSSLSSPGRPAGRGIER